MATKQVNFDLQTDQRTMIVGMTGSGKTVLAENLLSQSKRLVVFDAKDEFQNRFNLDGDWTRKTLRLLEQGENVRIRVPPLIGETKDLPKLYDEYFKRLYEIANLTVYIDEVYSVTNFSTNIEPYLGALYTRGRSLNISVWASTQRPTMIPLFMLTESQMFFVFRLSLDKDRQRMAQIIGDPVREPIKDKYGFYAYHTDQNKIYYSPGLKISK